MRWSVLILISLLRILVTDDRAWPKESPVAHVFLIIMENEGYRKIVGSPDAPYFNSLISRGRLLTNYWSVAHPSLPNYVALMGAHPPLPGSDNPGTRISGDSLPEEMVRHGHSVRSYMQGLPRPGFGGNGYPVLFSRYVLKHDPFLLFRRIRKWKALRREVQPLSRLPADLARRTGPELSLIVPDLCHDMHGAYVCHFRNDPARIRAGDRFLAEWVPRIIASEGDRPERSWIFILWDESDWSQGSRESSGRMIHERRIHSGGRVPFLWIGGKARPGWTSDCFANHYSLLETLTRNFGLPPLAPPGERIPLPFRGRPCPK